MKHHVGQLEFTPKQTPPLQRVGLGELFPKLLEEFHNLRETSHQERASNRGLSSPSELVGS